MEYWGFKVSQDCDISAVLLLSLKEVTGRGPQSSQQQVPGGHECKFQHVLLPASNVMGTFYLLAITASSSSESHK